MTADELTTELCRCNMLAERRERLIDESRKFTEASRESRRAATALAGQLLEHLGGIATLLSLLPDGQLLAVGEYLYGMSDDGPVQFKAVRVHQIGDLIANHNEMQAEVDDDAADIDSPEVHIPCKCEHCQTCHKPIEQRTAYGSIHANACHCDPAQESRLAMEAAMAAAWDLSKEDDE